MKEKGKFLNEYKFKIKYLIILVKEEDFFNFNIN
jgi:hypothetical protein